MRDAAVQHLDVQASCGRREVMDDGSHTGYPVCWRLVRDGASEVMSAIHVGGFTYQFLHWSYPAAGRESRSEMAEGCSAHGGVSIMALSEELEGALAS